MRLVTVKAGPCAPVPKADLPRFLPEFLGGVLRRAERGRARLRHRAQPLLALGVGRAARPRTSWGVPLVASFHTLGKVKNYSLARGEAPEPPSRLAGRGARDRRRRPHPRAHARGGGAARGALPRRSRTTSGSCRPGVDHTIFFPRERAAARERLHLSGLRLALFVGRLQPHKGPDVAVRTLAEAVARDPELTAGPGARDRGRSERDRSGRRGGQADGAGGGARRERAGDAVPAAAAGAPGRLVRGGRRRARPVALGVVRSGGARGAGVRHAGGRRQPSAACGSSSTTGGPGSWSRGTTPRITPSACSRSCGTRALADRLGVAAAKEALRFTWDATATELAGIYRELAAAAHDPGRARDAPPGRGARLPADPRVAERPRGLVAHGLRAAVLAGRHRREREARHRGRVPVHHRGRRPTDRPDRDQRHPPARPDLRRSTSSSATARRGGRVWGRMRSTPCSPTRSRGSTSIRSSCGRWPRTSVRSARTRIPGSGRKHGSPSARGRTAGGSIVS